MTFSTMKTALRLLLAGLIALAGVSYAIPELTNTEATNVDTAAERLAWQQAIGTDFEGKSGNFTAEVNGRYVATATLTVTDPSSPAAGDTFVTYVRSGTATVGGTAYATAGTMIVRAYAGGAWASKVFTPDDAVAITGGTATLSSASIQTPTFGANSTLAEEPVRIKDGTSTFSAYILPTTLTADRTIYFPNVGGTITLNDATQTLTNKTISGGTITGLSSASITGDLTVDTSTLKVDSTNNKAGFRLTAPKGVVSIGDGEASSSFTIPHLAFEYAGGGYANAIHSRHDGAGPLNSLDFYTSDGTQHGSFPSNYVHGMSVQSGKVGIGTGAYNPTTALTIGNSGTISFTANSGTWNGATIAGDQTASGAWTFNGNVSADKTITAAATTGAQTINKNAGSVNFAAAATSLVVTNSRVTTSSVIICTIGTNDATMTSVQAVAASGSFTIYANAAPTAETRVNFLIIN